MNLENEIRRKSIGAVDESGEWFKALDLDVAEEIAYSYAKEMLTQYTDFLQKHGYIDTDATMEEPTAIDEFLKHTK